MTTLTELQAILITCLPALTSIITILVAVKSILNSLSKLKENEELKVERDALKQQNEQFMAEARKTRKQLQLFIQKCTHTVYEDLTEVKNDEELQN